MSPVMQIFRSTVDPGDAARLLELRPGVMEALMQACPQLRRADLVRIDEATWLDVLVWRDAAGPDAVMQHVRANPAALEMHALVRLVLAVGTGELAHTTQP